MIHIKVIGAENLLLLPDKLKKTRISCYSYSSYRYYYGTFKSREKSTTPEFNAEFDVDLFRAINLSFSLFMSDDTLPVSLIGNVSIDLPQFLIKGVGKRMLDSPSTTFSFKFPITASVNEKPFLILQMSYKPKDYEPINIEEFKDLPIVHLWATYDPPVPITNKTPVEIELLQAYPIDNLKSKTKLGYYFHLNSKYSWESVGKSSTNKPILGSTGLTQIHSFSLPKIQGKYNFLILNVVNYTGVVKLNFIGEEKGKITNLGDSNYINLSEQVKVGILKTIEINVEANAKYCAPVLLCYNNKSGKIVFAITGLLPCLCNKYKSDETLEEPDSVYGDEEFRLKIIEEASKIIPGWDNVNFKKTSILPKFDAVSLSKTFQSYNIQDDHKIRLYLGSAIPFNGGGSTQTDVWTPTFVVYDKANGSRCQDIEKDLMLRPTLEFPTNFFAKSFLHFKFNSFIKIDLSKYGPEKVIIFAMTCATHTKQAPHGIYLITHSEEENETLFFRNLISAGSPKVHFVVCFRLECVEGDWQIIPMRHYFREQKKMIQALDSMYVEKWSLSKTMSQINDTFISESSDGEPLTPTAKAKKI